MKKFLVGLMVVAMGLMLMSPVASAYPVSAGDKITINWGIGNANNGGSFTIDKVEDGQGVLFDTFCLERNEYFSPGGSYWIGSITDGAINGGLSGGNPDYISSQTAYLYSRWASPWVTNGIAHTAANANALQLAIWTLEGEWTTALSGTALAFWTMANTYADGTSLYGVQVMNIYGTRTGTKGAYQYSDNKQDMLVANQIPEPATMLLFGLGLLALAGLRRKFKK